MRRARGCATHRSALAATMSVLALTTTMCGGWGLAHGENGDVHREWATRRGARRQECPRTGESGSWPEKRVASAFRSVEKAAARATRNGAPLHLQPASPVHLRTRQSPGNRRCAPLDVGLGRVALARRLDRPHSVASRVTAARPGSRGDCCWPRIGSKACRSTSVPRSRAL